LKDVVSKKNKKIKRKIADNFYTYPLNLYTKEKYPQIIY